MFLYRDLARARINYIILKGNNSNRDPDPGMKSGNHLVKILVGKGGLEIGGERGLGGKEEG